MGSTEEEEKVFKSKLGAGVESINKVDQLWYF